MSGALIIAGTGIQPASQMTPDTRHWIAGADEVLYLVADPLSEQHVRALRPDARSLAPLYDPARHRLTTYEAMVEAMLAPVRLGKRVCAIFYGHPGVFAIAPHVALRQALAEGHRAEMLPAVSALDCLIADLGLDPGIGLQTYDATLFLARRLAPDPHALLVLWQVGALGELRQPTAPARDKLGLLSELLCGTYGGEHRATLYEAAVTPGLLPTKESIALAGLASAPITHNVTLVIPPRSPATLDEATLARLGLRGITRP